MTTAHNQDLALNFILQAYADQLSALKPAKPVPGTKVKAPKASKPRAIKAAKPIPVVSTPTFIYAVGSVGPEGFFSLLRKARGAAEEREAINAYCGYTTDMPHGHNLDQARRQATMALKPWLGNRSAKSTVEGYVKGMPQTVQRDIDNLLAREKNCAEELSTLHNRMSDIIGRLTADTLGNDEETNLRAERDLTRGLLLVSEERLQAIRNDLRQLQSIG